MELTLKDHIEIAQDLLEAGINVTRLRAEEGPDAVLQAWCDLGDEGWTVQ